ncbi:MAG: shikimate kinase [Candidatus Omnitrophota bacterium]
MRNIVLVGFMGTGKTEVAVAIAEKLAMSYVSADKLIEKKEKTSIKEIFAKNGEAYFRKVEKEVIAEASSLENAVIDTGGGVVIDPENVKNLKKNGILICLWADPEVIFKRTEKYSHRPLLKVRRPIDTIKELLDIRKPFYERADYHINTSKMSIKEVVHQAERIIKNG